MSALQSVVCTVFLLSGVGDAVAQTTALPVQRGEAGVMLDDLVATQNFQREVAAYVTLHRFLEGQMPPIPETANAGEVQRTIKALGTRVQAARATAKQGDLITPEVARMFRRRIAACLTPEEWAAILGEMVRDDQGEPLGSPPALHVNMEWPERVAFDLVPPQLLQSLPALPPELQYRLIGRSLVLWDHHANLIVDFLPGAFAMTT